MSLFARSTQPSKTSHLLKGAAAEDLAASFLQQQGLKIITRNYNCQFGELDLICQTKAQELVFVEVRFRKNQQFGGALTSVTKSKQQKLHRTATYYLSQLQHQPPCRFDVIALTTGTEGQIIIENWIQNAF